MRATGDRLEERFIIPIARELAEGLRAIHAAGVIHRDVKGKDSLALPSGFEDGAILIYPQQLQISSFMKKEGCRSATLALLVFCNPNWINGRHGLGLPTGCLPRCFPLAVKPIITAARYVEEASFTAVLRTR